MTIPALKPVEVEAEIEPSAPPDRIIQETLTMEDVASEVIEQQLEQRVAQPIHIEPSPKVVPIEAKPKAQDRKTIRQQTSKPETITASLISPAQEITIPAISSVIVPEQYAFQENSTRGIRLQEAVIEPQTITTVVPEIVYEPSSAPVYQAVEAPVLELKEVQLPETFDEIEETKSFKYFEPGFEDTEPDVDWVEIAIRDILGNDIALPSALHESENALTPDYSPEWYTGSKEKNEIPTTLTAELEEELTPYLEPLNVEETETVITLAAAVIETARSLQHRLRQETPDSVELEPEIKELKEVCIQLLETLGIVVEEETLESFMRFILTNEPLLLEATGEIQSVTEEGTHEQKQHSQSVLAKLAQLISRRPSLHNLLGSIALKFRSATSLPRLEEATLLSSNL